MRKLFKVVPLFVLLLILLNISIVSAQDIVPLIPEIPEIKDWADLSQASLVASEADVAATNAAWASAGSRASAQAYPMPTGAGALDVPMYDAAEILGPPGFSPAGAPDAQANAVARQEFPEAWQEMERLEMIDDLGLDMDPMATEGTANVYNAHYGNFWGAFWKEYPYKTVGILRYQDANNRSWYCSASIISPNNILVTAAHCLYDTTNNRWHKNWRFYPAERSGNRPYGSFNWAAAQILPAYIRLSGGYSSSWAKYDVGLIRLANNGSGRGVTYYTGWLGRGWNYSCPLLLTTIGYPANRPNGRRYSYINQAECYKKDTNTYGQGSSFKGGSSGGPWIYKFRPYESGAKNYVLSVVSGGPTSSSLRYMWGPRFTNSNIVRLCNSTITKC